MKLRKTVSLLAAAAMIGTLPGLEAGAEYVSTSSAEEVKSYSYEITPLMAPFNEYYFVKTDNPDPYSFAFGDKSSVYSEKSVISVAYDSWNDVLKLFSDVDYENTATARVNGGYIFYSGNTDGGELTLQYRSSRYSWSSDWQDTDVKYTIPAAKNYIDYLIDTYATKSSFFENMDAVQSGLSSICLYSGSNIRGEVYRHSDYWAISNSPHKDQTFYIQSPFSRKDNKSLFASAVYPFIADSLGFPSIMGSVSKKLDPNSSYVWDSNNHYLINVTCDGTTKSYGGQGNGKGQGIDQNNITRRFSFGSGEPAITLPGIKSLLDEYAGVEMSDDVPRDDELKWEDIWQTVGSGSWVRLMSFGSSSVGYSYLFGLNDGDYYWDEDCGTGSSIYWGGDLGYATNGWVDGRYVNGNEIYEAGAVFDDHPTSNLILRSFKFPELNFTKTYDHYDYDTQTYVYNYSNITVTEKTKNVRFSYNSTDKVWRPYNEAYANGKYFSDYQKLVELGLLDSKYLDAIELTEAEVRAMNVDANTNAVPNAGFIYDRSAAPGTPFAYAVGDINHDNKINMKDLVILLRALNDSNASVDTILADTAKDGKINMKDYVRLERYLVGFGVTLGTA